MKKLTTIITLFLIFVAATLHAQQNIVVNSDGSQLFYNLTSQTDSIKFANNYTNFYNGSTSLINLPINAIDSLTFDTTPAPANKIYIIYNDNSATIINPFANAGVTITAQSAQVTINSTSAVANIEYNLLGTSANGSLTVTSTQPMLFRMNNLNLTNASGPAIKINSAVATTFSLKEYSINTLADNASSTINGTVFTSGSLIITDEGTLNIKAAKKHGINASESVTIHSGTVNVLSANGDALHSEGFTMNSGNLNIAATVIGDGIDAGAALLTINGGNIQITSTENDVKAIKTDGNIVINGGTLQLTVSGNQSKAISSRGNVTINGGILNATVSGNVVLETLGSGFDPSYPTAIKADGALLVTNGTITLNLPSTAGGGKGFSADGNVTITGGKITMTLAGNGATYTNDLGVIDSYSSTGIKSDSVIDLQAGEITITNSGTAGKGISADGAIILGVLNANNLNLKLNVTTTGNRFLVSGSGQSADYANPKAVKAEGNLTVNSGTITINCTQNQEGGEGLESKNILTINGGDTHIETYDDSINATSAIVINGGTTYCKARGNDGIDSNGTITINGGFTISNGARTPEEGFDCDNNTFAINGGIIVGTGGATSNPTSSASSQKAIKVTTTLTNNTATTLAIKNAANTNILVYTIPAFTNSGGNSTVTLLFTNPTITNGIYTVSKGVTVTGGTTTNGYNTGGTVTGGTATTFTVSSNLTSVTAN